MAQSDLPIVCSLTPQALAARRLGLLTELLDLAEDHELLSEGMRFGFRQLRGASVHRASGRRRTSLVYESSGFRSPSSRTTDPSS
jgi:hypothetical protein